MTLPNVSAVVPLAQAAAVSPRGLMKALLEEIDTQGTLWVQLPDGSSVPCDWLETGLLPPRLARGDQLLVWPAPSGGRGVVMGRIAPYRSVCSASDLAIEAEQSMAFRCGQSSVELRADGKVLFPFRRLFVVAYR